MWPHHEELVNVRYITVCLLGTSIMAAKMANHADFIDQFFFPLGTQFYGYAILASKTLQYTEEFEKSKAKGFFLKMSFYWQALICCMF